MTGPIVSLKRNLTYFLDSFSDVSAMLHCLVWSARVLDLTVLVSLSNQPRGFYPLKRLKCLMKSDALSEKTAYLSHLGVYRAGFYRGTESARYQTFLM